MTSLQAPTPTLRTSGALAGVVSGAAIAVSGFLPLWISLVVFLCLGLALAWGWPRLLDLPSPRGTTSVLGVTNVALAAVMLASASGHRTRWAGAVLCLGLIGSFLHQLLRQDGRPRLVTSLAGTALGLGFLGAGSYLVPAQDLGVAQDLLVSVGAAVAVSAVLASAVKERVHDARALPLHVGAGALAGLVGVCVGAGLASALLSGAAAGLLSWASLRTTVAGGASAHTRAQIAAGCSAALVCCFIPFVAAQLP